MGKHLLFKGNCLDRIDEVGDNSIALTVTSPPYFNAKVYGGEEDNVGNNKDYEDYLNKIRLLLTKLYKKMVDGGIVCWNSSPVLDEGLRIGIPFDTNKIFIDLGFQLLEDVVWKKPSGAAKLRVGGWIQNQGKPMTYHCNITTEYIMVYKKPGIREVGEFDDFRGYYPNKIIPKDLITNVWEINPETSKHYHDAPFPYELAKRCILLWSFKGDTVLDPFLGSGTVMKVARDLKRNSIGMELSDEYVKVAKDEMGFYQKALFDTEEYKEL